MKRYVAYYRVSTHKQSLGIDAQKTLVQNYLKSRGGEIITEYEEKESGKNNNRPELKRAIEDVKKNDATLLIAKLDRLSRNALFILTLSDSKIPFICCDMPEANELTVGIMAVLAQSERKMISDRTKAALFELKSKGVILGNPTGFKEEFRKLGPLARKQKALNSKENTQAKDIINRERKEGKTLKQIADKLNRLQYRTVNGKEFKPTTVQRLVNN
jgi:DNA invertase Pin-like site-specific DNA recombinase